MIQNTQGWNTQNCCPHISYKAGIDMGSKKNKFVYNAMTA